MSKPQGSCLICGYDKPFKSWINNIEGIAVAGVCEECLNHARGYSTLETQCAAMREALERFKFPGFINDCIPDNYMFTINIPVADFRQAEQALSNGAGKALLERLHKLEIVAYIAKEAKDLIKKLQSRLYDDEYCVAYEVVTELGRLLAELERDKDG